MKPRPPEDRGGQERALIEHVEQSGKSRDGRHVLHLHLSRLAPVNRRSHHLRIVANTIQPLAKEFYGQLFALGNQDLVLALRGASPASVNAVILKVCYLFGNDPASKNQGAGGGLVSLYDLEQDYDACYAAVLDLEKEEMRRQKRGLAPLAAGSTPADPALVPDRVDLHRLAELVETISRADLSNFLRRQSVCALLPQGPPEAIFQEIYMSVPDLCGQLMPEHTVATDRWTFQHLTQTLDRRMLEILKRQEDTELAGPVSINVNISTILSAEFSIFDQALRPPSRNAIMLEVQLVDVFSDLGTFIFARDYAHSRGYRLCLDGLDEQSLAFIDREQLGMDLVKLIWTPALSGTMHPSSLEELRRDVQRIGRDRLILCRCGEPAALAFGQSVGIALYQGRQIERMTAPVAAQPRRYAAR